MKPGNQNVKRSAAVHVQAIYENGDEWRHKVLPFASYEARNRGWHLLRGWEYQGNRQAPKSIDICGVITDCGLKHALVRKLHKAGCPIVQLTNENQMHSHALPAVNFDLESDGRLAAKLFHDRKFRHVGYEEIQPSDRLRALNKGFYTQSVLLDLRVHRFRMQEDAEGITTRQVRGAFLQWLKAVPKPIGILTRNDYRAAQFTSWVQEAGFDIPQDVALLGRGDDESICDCVFPSLSSIELDYERRTKEACKLLAHLMSGGTKPKAPIMIPPKGIADRESTNILATSDPHVAAALRYMWDHLDLDLSVDDIAREVGVARRTLECAFRKQLHRGINAELRRKRLESFRDLLISSDTPIADLAPMVGFRTMVHLQRSFRRAFGMSPRQYRALEKIPTR